VAEALEELRRRHPSWGAGKLLTILEGRHPGWQLPTRSTGCELLKRAGLVRQRRRRSRLGHPGPPLSEMSAPNAVWSADFKGQFKTRDGVYCYPLTVSDGFSRYLLGCQGLRSPCEELSRPVLTRLFEEFGLPWIIRTDNGSPFASTALGRLSRLSVWWIRLGIEPELIEPASPAQNGRHERMHKPLKAETARPPAGSLSAQQARFNRFRREYNEERPHEALGQRTLALCTRGRRGLSRGHCLSLSTQGTSRLATSVRTAGFAGRSAG
jgi:transposase InsO family protein